MRAGWHLLVALALWCAANGGALAEKRVALVVGNSAYQHSPALANPANDADAIAKLFKEIGFDAVDLHRDLPATELRRAIREFSLRARDADVAIVFYAGHGFEMNGTNYLVPIDAKLERDFDVEDETVPLDRFLDAVDPARRLRLLILDACRDNPFVKKIRRTVATRAIGQGLAKIDVTSTDTLIAFAAKAGSVATEGEGPHSPFTAALLKHLPTPGLDVRILFGRVRDDVFTSTARRQEPFVYGSLGGSDVMIVPAQPSAPAANARDDYEAAERVGTLEAWDVFLTRYNTGFFANLAREQRAKLLQTGRPEGDEAGERKRQEEERARAARLKAEADAKKQREEEERRAQAAEAERQRADKLRAEREKAERERAERETAERERAEREKAERERAERARADREQAERERADKLRAEREQAERERARREELARIEREAAQREQARREEMARAEEEQRLTRERVEREKDAAKLAMLPPVPQPPAARPHPQLSKGDLILAIKRQLRRVGCYPGKIDEGWGDAALTRSIAQFVKYAKFSGATDEPNYDFLDALTGSGPGVCSLECGGREVARNGRCVPKGCPPGQAIGSDGGCIAVAPGAR